MNHLPTIRPTAWLLALCLSASSGCTSVPQVAIPSQDSPQQARNRLRQQAGFRPGTSRTATRELAQQGSNSETQPSIETRSKSSGMASPVVTAAAVADRPSGLIVQTSGTRRDAIEPAELNSDETEDLPTVPRPRQAGRRRSQATSEIAYGVEDRPAVGQLGTATGKSLTQRLTIPQELPGADAPPISLPNPDPAHPESRSRAIDKLFPQLPPVPAAAGPQPQPGDLPWDLLQLEQFAMENNPLLVQASADIDSAAGIAWQSGMYPNPTVGYEGDTVNSNGTLNYQGVFINQTIKTAGKLELARMSADVDTLNTRLTLRKTRIDVLTKVRANYYAVLVAQESVRTSKALVHLTEEVFRLQVEQLQGGLNAAYEPMQLRALAVQSRGALRQAQNRYTSAWRQLSAALGTPDLPPKTLSGRADAPLPEIQYDATLEHVVDNHTDVLTARNKVTQACINVRKEEVVPIPDVGVYTAVQRDFTTPPVLRYTYNLQIGVPVPIFDQNRGGIMSAHALLIRAKKEEDRVRNELTAQLADAYERYQTNRVLADYYRTQILPDQARAYRGVYERYQQDSDQPGFGFGEIVVAQQNLLSSINTYLSSLNSAWAAVTDIQSLLQMDPDQNLPAAASGSRVPSPATSLREPQPLAPIEKEDKNSVRRGKRTSPIRQASYSGFKGRNVSADKTD